MFPTTPLAEFLRGLASLRRSPGFALAAVLLLGTGIGAVTIVYSLVNAILVKPLPYARPAELVGIQAMNRAKSLVQASISAADFRDLGARQTAFASIGAYRPDFATWKKPGEQPVQMVAALVTEDFFRVLGINPLQGRTFSAGEFSLGSGAAVLLGEECWRRQFNARADVIGTVITLNGRPTRIVGVMPASMREPAFVDAWLPFAKDTGENFARDSRYWVTIGRLAPGSTLAQANAEVMSIAQDLERQFPDENRGWAMSAAPLHELRVAGVRTTLWLLLAATSLLILVACFNLASLLLGRGIRRRGEMALRQAIGATPRRLLGQVLAETAAIALPGALVGFGLAHLLIKLFVARVPPELLPRSHEVSLDVRVFVVGMAVALVASILAGLLPAIQAARVDAGELIKESSSRAGVGPGIRRMQRGLLICQVAVTFVVLTGATLLWRSLSRLTATPPGFSPEGVYLAQVSPPPLQFEGSEDMANYFERLVLSVGEVSGVESASVDASTPLGGITLRFPYTLVGGDSENETVSQAVYHFVTTGYEKTLRLPLRSGRGVEESDNETAEPVVWVNEALARLLAPNGDAVGRELRLVPWLSQRTHRVVGVFADTRQENLTDSPPPQLYVGQRQVTWFFTTLLVRLEPGRSLPIQALREAVHRVDPGLSGLFVPHQEYISRTTVQPQLLSRLFLVLGATTLAFTLFGVYACVSFTVAQRTPEYGLRMALGASPRAVVAQMSLEISKLVVAGLLAGLAAAVMFNGVIRSQLHGVGAHDPASLLGAALGLTVAALISAGIPVWRAGRVAPAEALRHA